MKQESKGWICVVGYDLKAYGVSHAVVGHVAQRARPVVACRADVRCFNWTLNPYPKTRACKKCLALIG
jgi:hypothetical protein